ncbi:MAG: hypothetical protein Roseis2KO_39020 [Roseivirga sp.]
MSWDLFVQDWGNVKSLEELPENFEPGPIGERTQIIEQISKAEPTVDFSDPAWGILQNDQFSIEFNMGEEENLYSFAMHIRGEGRVSECIENILKQIKMRAISTSTGKFF